MPRITNLYTVYEPATGLTFGNFPDPETAIDHIEHLRAVDSKYGVTRDYDYRLSDEYRSAIKAAEKKHFEKIQKEQSHV